MHLNPKLQPWSWKTYQKGIVKCEKTSPDKKGWSWEGRKLASKSYALDHVLLESGIAYRAKDSE